LVDACVECFDAADAVLDDEGVDCLGEFVVCQEEVDELRVLCFEFGDSGESSVAGVHGGGLTRDWAGHVGVDDLVEGEVFGLGAELAVESGGGDDCSEVFGVVVGVAGGDEVARGGDPVDGAGSAAGLSVCFGAIAQGLGDFGWVGHVDGVHNGLK